ncbi:hypothetical protein GCM10027286_27290 [Virgibacillus ainsalahensis]
MYFSAKKAADSMNTYVQESAAFFILIGKKLYWQCAILIRGVTIDIFLKFIYF